MALIEMNYEIPAGGGETALIAYGKNAGNSSGINEYDYNSDYVSVSTDHKTITFIKACSGFIGFNNDYGSFSGTVTTTPILSANSTYADELWSFTANVGDTITFASQYWWSYEIIGS